MSHFLIRAAIYVFFHKEGKVLLMRRANTGYRDGQYSLPAGHVEEKESLIEAALREVKEETGLQITPESLTLKHAMFRRYPERTYADYYYVCETWTGEPQIAEPEKCDEALWADKNALPENTVTEVQDAWTFIQQGQSFSDMKY